MKRILSLVFILVMIATISLQGTASASIDKDQVPDIMKMSNFTILK